MKGVTIQDSAYCNVPDAKVAHLSQCLLLGKVNIVRKCVSDSHTAQMIEIMPVNLCVGCGWFEELHVSSCVPNCVEEKLLALEGLSTRLVPMAAHSADRMQSPAN